MRRRCRARSTPTRWPGSSTTRWRSARPPTGATGCWGCARPSRRCSQTCPGRPTPSWRRRCAGSPGGASRSCPRTTTWTTPAGWRCSRPTSPWPRRRAPRRRPARPPPSTSCCDTLIADTMAEKDPNRSTESGMFDRYGRVLPAGTVLFKEGDLGHHMYVIQSGKVQLTRRVRGQETYLATLPAGEFFGEMAIINNLPRTATATVLEESRVLELDARTFELIIRGNAEIAVRLIKKLAARLEQSNRQVETLLKQNIHHRIVHHLRQLAASRSVAEY